MTTNENATAPVSEHVAVIDALYRFRAGIDHNDAALLATAFSDDAVVDFSPCGRRMSLDFPVLTDGDTIVRFLGATAETRTTTHVCTNGRAHLDGDTATLRALVSATHLPRSDHSRRCQMMNC